MALGYSEFSPPTPTMPLESTPTVDSTAQNNTTEEANKNSATTEGIKPEVVAGNVPNSPTLDQELNNVMAGLGSFWGKVKKSSVNVYQTSQKQIDQLATTARADLAPLLVKTKQNLDSFSETAKAELNRLSEISKLDVIQNDGDNGEMFVGADGNVVFISTVTKGTTKKDLKGKGVDRSENQGEEAPSTSGGVEGEQGEEGRKDEPTPAALASAQASAFFSKLSIQLASNPNFKELSKNLSTLQHSVSNNLSTLPTSLTTNLNHLQHQLNSIDLHDSTKLAEEYLLKGEGWISEMGQEVQRLAKEAVMVLPPDASLLSSKDKRKEERMKEAEQVAVGRKESLLMRLRGEASIILLVDPAQPPPSLTTSTVDSTSLSTSTSTAPTSPTDTREAYSKFLSTIEQSGGIEGTEFNTRIANELNLTVSNAGENLKLALEELVPGKMSSEIFWCRYFFRVGQIEEDEVRRRRVLEVAAGEEEDFSWDAEDEDDESESASTTAATTASITTSQPTPSSPTPLTHQPVKEASSPSSTGVDSEDKSVLGTEGGEETSDSRRESSEATTSSYDLVGIKSGEGSEAGEIRGEEASVPVASGKEEKKAVEVEKEKEDSGEDSDWE